MYQFLWIFFIYAFLGWCMEVCFAALVSGKFVNRGFLNGTWCPIYGFGVVIVLACLTPIKENPWLLFAGSVALTSALEFLTGFVLEKLFHQRWWDYSEEPFNVKGYICLRFSIAWGLACMFVVEFLHPTIQWLVGLLPHTAGVVLLAALCAVMAVDLAATLSTIIKLNRRLALIDELAARIKENSNDFGEDLAARVLDAAEKGEDWKQELEDLNERIVRQREEMTEKIAQQREEITERISQQREEMIGKIAQRREEMADNLDDWRESGEKVRKQLEEWIDESRSLLGKESFGQKRMLKAFPKLRSLDHKDAMERLHRHLNGK